MKVTRVGCHKCDYQKTTNEWAGVMGGYFTTVVPGSYEPKTQQSRRRETIIKDHPKFHARKTQIYQATEKGINQYQ